MPRSPTPATAAVDHAAPTAPRLHVGPGPHLGSPALTRRRVMLDVLIGLLPVVAASVWVFRSYAVFQVALCVGSCLVAEALFTAWRGRRTTLGDLSAAITGVILGLSLPWSAPWSVGVIASFVAIGLGKAAFGGLGQNVFNPAMVGRAFVMISFASVMGGTAYVRPDAPLRILTQATPLSVAKEAAGSDLPGLWALLVGNVNGSLGETSVLACLIGGLYLCWRRSAAWEIPVSMVAGAAAVAGAAQSLSLDSTLSVTQHLGSGALVFAAFFIATDPVTSPLTGRGRLIFGAGLGALVVFIRLLSNYPEGVVFAVLLMNAAVPLINRWTVPRPFGGPLPVPEAK